uniref:Cytochrome c oxidase copper chaperone n=1 Tax=Amblyomma maculatum TaxID=34609 RepID=G3MS04_AMBMU
MGNIGLGAPVQPTPPESSAATQAASTLGLEQVTKPKKKICCACPDTKRLRDECIVQHGEDACTKWIEAHKLCLRSEGFNV